MPQSLSSSDLIACLRAAGEPTRLRLLVLLREGEFNVKELTQILGQSQPRISRHLKLLAEAGLIGRFQEGSSVFFRMRDGGATAPVIAGLLGLIDANDALLVRDLARAEAVRQARREAAQGYFRTHAAAWDHIRTLYVAEHQVEAAMVKALGPGPFDLLLDLGTGTGRMLELFADRAKRALGFDVNRDMLSYARAKLVAAGIAHAQVRLGDIFNLPVQDAAADAVIIHQVLHFIDDPDKAVAEAARVLKPGGQLLIVDFAPHDIEALREDYAHRRLGFDRAHVEAWCEREGLIPTRHCALRPDAPAGDKLTVSLWLAVKADTHERRPAASTLTAIQQ